MERKMNVTHHITRMITRAKKKAHGNFLIIFQKKKKNWST